MDICKVRLRCVLFISNIRKPGLLDRELGGPEISQEIQEIPQVEDLEKEIFAAEETVQDGVLGWQRPGACWLTHYWCLWIHRKYLWY